MKFRVGSCKLINLDYVTEGAVYEVSETGSKD